MNRNTEIVNECGEFFRNPNNREENLISIGNGVVGGWFRGLLEVNNWYSTGLYYSLWNNLLIHASELVTCPFIHWTAVGFVESLWFIVGIIVNTVNTDGLINSEEYGGNLVAYWSLIYFPFMFRNSNLVGFEKHSCVPADI